MNENETPETDKSVRTFQTWDVPSGRHVIVEYVFVHTAKKLERERDEARDQRDAITLRLGQTQEHLVDARRSAEQWRAVAAKYAGCTESECNRHQ